MLKVKEYLDENFAQEGECAVEGSNNGVFGCWKYPKDYKPIPNSEWYPGIIYKDHIQLCINNETMQTDRIYIDGKYVSKYSYLQTYQHIPRGKPDANGYYRRSTDEEVIRYIDSYLQQIKEREKCKTQA
jgi:hypothetical protein